ncbi:MAG TPA: NADH-ubiquinone oxidoreductase-F iron-sulfur binding region domain-containing protein [Trebonia sp.]|jgi:NADH:ubiquinone oxidoreductase subunit F (NADH-binding)|nr:NADH-ubiquinone oxidoreductase-F iron-sulfur binding region domain-containing protein [Trebonia sp.]
MTTATTTGLPRLLPRDGGRPEDWRLHMARFGPIPYRGSTGRLIDDVREAGLTGRGGAAFPAHRKLAAVAEAAANQRVRPVVIANGAEGEPASDKDATLLWLAPHLVLDGLQLAAEAAGADRAILYTHEDRRDDVGRRLRAELRQRRDDRVDVVLATAPPRFLAGQETALVNHLGGGPAVPRFPLPRVTERGLDGVPTLVQNAETLAHMALIARYGPRWFRQLGTGAEPGSLLTTVRRGGDGRPRIVEVPFGVPLMSLLGDLEDAGAVLVGGYHGTWLPTAQAMRLRLDNESLRSAGAAVGAGILAALPGDRCGLAETARVVRYLALESAGQCGPCLNGLPRMSAALTALATGRAAGRAAASARADLERWAGLVTGRGACHHPDGTARFVRSALRTFAGELDRHERGRCGAANRAPYLPVPSLTARTEEDWL